ncbi:MAG: hypothetical protein RSC40_00920, partial [Clostridia bacterium]
CDRIYGINEGQLWDIVHLIGAFIMGVLNNGMSIMGISSNTQQVVKGLVLLGAVAFDILSKQQVALPIFQNKHKAKKATASNVKA